MNFEWSGDWIGSFPNNLEKYYKEGNFKEIKAYDNKEIEKEVIDINKEKR